MKLDEQDLSKIDKYIQRNSKGRDLLLVDECVQELTKKLSIPEEIVINRIQELIDLGKISALKPKPKRVETILEYIRNPFYQLEITFFSILTVFLTLFIILSENFVIDLVFLSFLNPIVSSLRGLVSIVYLLVIPGYFFSTFLFPYDEEIDNIERLALGLGLSLAIIIISGLLLNFTYWGITSFPFLNILIAICGLLLDAILMKPLEIITIRKWGMIEKSKRTAEV